MKTLRKPEASGPEFKVATLQNYISPERSLKYITEVCMTQQLGLPKTSLVTIPSCGRTVLKNKVFLGKVYTIFTAILLL